MAKSYRSNSDDNEKPNYREMDQAHRSMVAMGMITAGTGKKQVFRDRRDRRAKDARNGWERDQER